MFDIQRFNDDFGLLSDKNKKKIDVAASKIVTITSNEDRISFYNTTDTSTQPAAYCTGGTNYRFAATVYASPGYEDYVQLNNGTSSTRYNRSATDTIYGYESKIPAKWYYPTVSATNHDSLNDTIKPNNTYSLTYSSSWYPRRLYAVAINESKSSPSGCCTYPQYVTLGNYKYENMAYGATAASVNLSTGAFTENSKIPCSLFVNGPWIIDSRRPCLALPRWYTYVRKSGTTVEIIFATWPVTSDFKCYAFGNSSSIYHAVYLVSYASGSSSSFCGLPNVATIRQSNNTNNCKTIVQHLSTANASSSFFVSNWQQRFYIWAVLVLLFKTLNLKAACGYGSTIKNAASATSGDLSNYPYFYGKTSSDDDRVKVLGIQDLWGYSPKFLLGLIAKGKTLYVSTTNKTASYYCPDDVTAQSGWEKCTLPAKGYWKTSQVVANTLVPLTVGASATTYYCSHIAPASSDSAQYYPIFDDSSLSATGPLCFAMPITKTDTYDADLHIARA